MGLWGRALHYEGIETQERIYQARTAVDVVGGVEDQLRDRGWGPLTRERRSDGSLRVIYERLADEVDRDSRDPRRISAGQGIRPETARAFGRLVSACVLVAVTFAALALLATRP